LVLAVRVGQQQITALLVIILLLVALQHQQVVVVVVRVHQAQVVMEGQAAAVTGHHQLFLVGWVLRGKVIMAAMVVQE